VHDRSLPDRLVIARQTFHRRLAEALPDVRVVEVGGVEALVSPGAPERSVVNAAVLAEPPADAERFAADLAGVYRAAGVHAWTVWVPPRAAAATEGLAAAGHVFDGEPVAMGVALDGRFAAVPDDGLVLDSAPRLVELMALNDVVYRTGGSFARAAAGARDDVFRLFAVREGGRMISCLLTFDAGDDCVVELVATHPDARRRGLARGLLARALADGRARGRRGSTLVATAAGAPLYEGLGYERLERWEMWERREEPGAAS
jgi:GNAT superfamily N-acetyltransferase